MVLKRTDVDFQSGAGGRPYESNGDAAKRLAAQDKEMPATISLKLKLIERVCSAVALLLANLIANKD